MSKENTTTQNRIARKVYLYILRSTGSDDKFKIKAYFNNDVKRTFTRIEGFDEQKPHSPYIYRVELDFTIDDQNRLFIKDNGEELMVKDYRLQLSRKIIMSDKTYRDYNDEKDRYIEDPRHIEHYFLFDVNFSKNLLDSPPGENIPLWSQLCLYTYYLLHHQIYDQFESLIQQFHRFVGETQRTLARDELIDFFQSCITYSAYAMPPTTNQYIGEKFIIRITGILPITRKNFDLANPFVTNFAFSVIDDVREQYDDLFATITEKDWPLFRDGLATYLSIELLSKQKDTIKLVHRMKSEDCKKDLARALLLRLDYLHRPVLGLEWTSLFTLVDPNILTLGQIELAGTIKVYITSLTQIVALNIDTLDVTSTAVRHFDKIIYDDRLTVDLESIKFLIKFLQMEATETNESEKKVLQVVNNVIESSIELRKKIQTYLYSLTITIEDFKDIRFILSNQSNSGILFLVEKRHLLIQLLSLAHASYSYEFFKQWFCSFLLFNEEFSDWNKQVYVDVLKHWVQQLCKSYEIMIKIFIDMDNLINAFEKQQYRLIFIDSMINLCFQQVSVSIYRVIFEGLKNLNNELFLNKFATNFEHTYLTISQDKLKQLSNRDYPLSNLIAMDKQMQGQSKLINRLIELSASRIQFTTPEILQNTFERPTRASCIYAVLFEDCFKNLRIRQILVDQLLALWNTWEQEGFRANHLIAWKNFSYEERQIVDRIWNYIGEKAEKQYRIDSLIDKQRRDMEQKIETIERITKCLEIYCQHASDKNSYLDILAEMGTKLRSDSVRSIVIPEKIQTLILSVDRLVVLEKLNAWRRFLADYHQGSQNSSSESTTDSDLSELSDDESLLADQNLRTAANPLPRRYSDVDDDVSKDRRPCLDILNDTTKILDIFLDELKNLCQSWKNLPICKIIKLFPDIQYVDHDFAILEPLLNCDGTKHIKSILDYWKNRGFINHVCQGYINFMTNIEKVLENHTRMFQLTIGINDQTKGLNCSMYYNFIIHNVLERYSKEFLGFLAQYSLSSDLITFLNPLPSSDVDNLLQAVNDWDETIIHTKTILDFVMLKRFFVQFNIRIDSMKNDQSEFNIEHIREAFDQVYDDEQFRNLLNCFQTCSASLSSIKRIHLELTDKELSKRKRISDVMRQTKFGFIEYSNKFNVDIDSQSMSFSDLSELRDRARLIEYSTNSNNKFSIGSEYDIKELHAFVTFVEIIEKALKNFSLLHTAGHPSIIHYLSPNKTFTCLDSHYEELIEFSSMLDELLHDWEIYLCKMYEKHIDLTYFSYRQVWTIEDYLYNHLKTLNTNHSGFHLLKYIGINPETIRVEYLPVQATNPNERLENVGQILTAQRHRTNLTPKQENRLVKKIYLVETSDEGILRAILSLFKTLDTSIAVDHLFYCTEETSWTEIRAFTYRCFYSQTLHQLIRPELLSTFIQDNFTRLLRQLIDNHPHHYFRLGIITNVSNTQLQLINGLRTLQIVHMIHDQDMLNRNDMESKIKDFIDEYSLLVTSRINGLGKSSFIRKDIDQKNKVYLKFPISGDIDVDNIAQRLRDYGYQLTSSSAALHIDIGPVNNIKRLNELLYCLILFRSFRFGQIAVYIPNDIPIYIELDSSPYSLYLRDRIVLFKFMNSKHIDHIDWKEFEIYNQSTIQLVCNYLKAIKDRTIIKQDINKDSLIQYDAPTCISLLKDAFLRNRNEEYVTWTQLSICISVYYRLFSGFSRCGYFLIEHVVNQQLRLDILETLLQSSNQFTSLCVEDVRKHQRSVHDNQDIIPFSEAIVRWDKTQPFTVVFSASDDPIFVYKNPKDVPASLVQAFKHYHQAIKNQTQQQLIDMFPDYSNFTHEVFFIKLAQLSKKYFIKSICIKCYRPYEYGTLHCAYCEGNELLIQSDSLNNEDIQRFQIFIAEKLQWQYVLTPDNYIKMLLIYLRVQSGLPVLIMGETGCGKTALIQFLCQKILDDEMEVFRIHAGITREHILEQVYTFSIRAHECLQENKRLWVFFDEFNTTPAIGLIKEIICDRTLLGAPLPENMVLLGACNPQRRKEAQKVSDNHIGIKKDLYEMQRLKENSGVSLLYTVVPIPETMLEYIWDYGYLDNDIEKKYIGTMLHTCEQLSSHMDCFSMIINMISESHKFFRLIDDVSSVSLRDVARFCRIYNWFRRSIIEREGVEKFVNNVGVLLRRSSLIALLLCYYFRLSSPVAREDYLNLMNGHLKSQMPSLANIPNYLIKFLEMEQRKLIENMELPPGTAKNHALMDNIFVLLVCIVNRIPVIICGKPGCSKTSAVQIVISNLKGKKSSFPYFQKLPELVTVSYQGSQNCTSESIIAVFKRADKYFDVEAEANILPVIVFDEIGLAELSPHNPLKVLHSKLEVETCQYGFVGLSNWHLDAAKMNRTLYLSCPDPDMDDLKLTANKIAEPIISSQGQITPIDSGIIEALATSYYLLHEFLKTQQEQQKYTNYFGLRDFYSLIKGVVNDLIKTTKDAEQYQCIRQQLIINFDGILDGSQFMWKRFCQEIKREHLIQQYKSPAFKELLDLRLKLRRGRYLMLIAENETVIDYVERYIIAKHQPPSVRTLIGSCFSGDLISGKTYTEQYNYRVLMDIILYAETNVTLIMRRMGHLYDNLYDLFNQNFASSGKKKYCRIALGALYHPRCLVNDDFYCVVFIRKEDLAKCDPPFLNRFEKHIIDMKSLIHERQWTITDNLLHELFSLLPKNINKYFPLLQHLFVDFSFDYLCNLVIDAFDTLQVSISDESNTDEVINYCKNKLIATSSMDLLLILSLQSDTNHQMLIDQYYDRHTDLSFQSIIQQALLEKTLPNQVIYTYTQIYHVINYNTNEIEEVKLSIFKSELELTNKIKQHYKRTDGYRLLIIRVDYHQEHEHILLLKHILLNSKTQPTDRSVWLIFHLQRNLLNQTTNEVLFNGWSTIMINDLNESKLIPKSVLLNPSYLDLIHYPSFQLNESMLDEAIDRCLTKFRYTVSRPELTAQINIRRNDIIEYLNLTIQSQSLRSIIQANLLKLIKTISLNRFSDWRHDLLTNGILIGTCRSFNDALQSTISIYYENYLLLLFSHLEKYSFIDSLLFISKNANNDLLNKIWFDCLVSTINNIDLTIINVDVIEMPLIFNLRLPCAIKEYEIIRTIRQTIVQRRDDRIDEEELINLAMKQLRTKSVYESNIETILADNDAFTYYFNDQLLLAQDEAKIYELSFVFIQCLLMSNPTRSTIDQLRYLLIDYNELFEILRLFQMSTKLINENDFIDQIFRQQLRVLREEEKTIIKNQSAFYKLVLTNEHFCLLPPKSEMSDEHIFQCEGDPFIEVSLMNLIEFLISPTIITHADNIEQLTTTYSIVAQGILGLTHYSVNNLEKLRSFISLIRCITTLVSTDKALDVFKQACSYGGFDATFIKCDNIHKFIDHLQRIIATNEPNIKEVVIQRALLKLESEFLKNWLVDHTDEYLDVITLMSKFDNNLWQYSAKIFTYIDRKLKLLPMIQDFNGQLPSIDEREQYDRDISNLIDKYQQFDEHMRILNDSSRKIEHMMVTRLHMHLILTANNKEAIENILHEQFHHFDENIRRIQNSQKSYSLTLISLISWLKYYAQLYAFVFINDSHHAVLDDIDKLLTQNDFLFCSTIKLFILKQLCQMSNITLDELRTIVANRRVTWMGSMIALHSDQQTKEIRRMLTLPTPLFEYYVEFFRVDRVLANSTNINDIRQLVLQCQTNQHTFYCFIIWFIHYYTRFYIIDTLPLSNYYQQLIEKDLSKEIIECFDLIGYKLLVFLCTNFNETNYFFLTSKMTVDGLHQRLIALNIIAVLLSLKTLRYNSYLSSLLFDGNLKMPYDYTTHLETSVCLPGLISNDPIITQMMDVRTTVKQRLDQGQIHEPGKFIFQCSNNCPWMFYFVDCGVPVARSQCPLCKKEIGAERYGVLINRDPPQIQMTIQEGFQVINKYLEEYNKIIRHGYHNKTSAVQSNIHEKPDHLNRSISYRFMHMITHATLLVLDELSLLTNFDISNQMYFREHFEKDYQLLRQQINDNDQCYIWIYKLLNHMLSKDLIIKGFMNTNDKAMELEKLFEEKLIFTHIESVASEITQYKTSYAEYIRQQTKESTFDDYFSEISQNEARYPLLNFFNVTNIYTSNPLDEFRVRLTTLPYGDELYPITTFLMKRLGDYANIQYLYPIITFTNYLIDKFNHRIKRNHASETSISYYLTHGTDCETMSQLYQNFIDAWYQLELNEVRYGCQTTKFERTLSKENFAANTKIAMVLLNTTKDDSSILLAACLRTIGELQNEIVHFFHNKIVHDTDNSLYRQNAMPIQSIRPEHILQLDGNVISKKLITDGFTINYQYAKSKDIIYDYEEIEMTLRNMISCLPLIATEKLRFLNYQFELYSENTSLINDVRKRIKQQSLEPNEKIKLKNLIISMQNDDILHYLGSLDYVFTYLRNIDDEKSNDTLTIQAFVEKYIRSSVCLNDNVLQRPPFATIRLKYIIDLYELIEEIAFDQILRYYIKQNLTEEFFTIEQQKTIIKQFSDATYNGKIADSLKNIHSWIRMLKRLLVRVLSNVNVSLDAPIQIYLERTDLWTGNMTELDLQTFEVPETILLQHTYIILKGLESERDKLSVETNKSVGIEEPPAAQKSFLQNTDSQELKVKTWHNDSISNANMSRVIKGDKNTTRKMRV